VSPSLTDKLFTVPVMPGCTSVTSSTIALPLPLTTTLSVVRTTFAVETDVAVVDVPSIDTAITTTATITTANATHPIHRRRFFGAPCALI